MGIRDSYCRVAGLFIGMLLVCATLFAQVASSEKSDKFPEPPDTQAISEGFTTPEAALAAIRLPPGFRATLFAAEPAVRQPIALATDHRGRLWVAENYSYAQREVNFDKNLRDRITILADSDDDGQFDQRTVFWDQASKLTSVEIGFGGVWALCPPHLLFIPDHNGDDIPDGPPQVMLDGWDDDAVRHNIANGLRWGPDGWLYGRHGILATSQVGVPGTPPELRTKINCGVWRFHPTRHDFEVICQGTTNPWGMDWDQHGQLFFINTVIGHLWHVVPGAHFQRMYGEDLQPNVYELIPQTADHFHWDTAEVWSDIRTKGVTPTTDQAGGGHAHSGMLIYQGGSWPRSYHNSVLTVNLHGRRLNNDRLARRGSGYVGTHAPDFMSTSDPWFRGVELAAGSHGEIFVADWSDIGECHENDGVHRSSGRIFRIQSTAQSTAQPKKLFEFDLSKAMDSDLVAAQKSNNEWEARQARQVLQNRAASGHGMKDVHSQLSHLFASAANETHQLRAMWCLYVTAGANEEWLRKQLGHSSEHVRSWAVKLLCDRGEPTEESRKAFLAMAINERSGLVLSFLASALQRLSVPDRMPLAERLAESTEHAKDPVLPLLIWYGIEPAVVPDRVAAIQLAKFSQMPKLTEFVARRITTEIEHEPAAVANLVALLEDPKAEDKRIDVLRGMTTALRGWRKAPRPENWETVAAALARSKQSEVVQLTRELSVVFGDGRALDELRKIAESSSAELETRRAALRTLATAKTEGLPALLKKLLGERDLQVDAIRGLAAYHDPQTPQLLIDRFRALHASGQREAINTLVSRVAYATVLLAAVEDGELARDLVSPFHVRQMSTLGDANVMQKIGKLWPELRQHSEERARQISKYREQLTAEQLSAANLSAGRVTFQRACANCHILFGQGGKVGPDLTGAQRVNLNYLLENIVDPSATVSENFRMSIVIATDGRVINGVVIEKSERTLTIATPTDRIVIATDDIEEIRSSNLSIMPEGQLDVLTPEQTRDLIGYLMSPKQVELP